MKKYLLLILLIICTGCNKVEYLNCTKEQIDDDLKMNEKLKLEVKNNKPIFMNIDINFVLNGNYLEHQEIVKENISNIVSNYNNQKGINISQVDNDSSITINLIIDYTEFKEKLDNDILNLKRYQVEELNMETTKKYLESENYKCEISNKKQ